MAEITHEGDSPPPSPEGSFLLAMFELRLYAGVGMTDVEGEALHSELQDDVEASLHAVAERINERQGDRLTRITVVA